MIFELIALSVVKAVVSILAHIQERRVQRRWEQLFERARLEAR